MDYTEVTYNAISLFSGLGGDSLGMTQAGCKIIAYNELKPMFCNSHDANFPDSERICDGTTNDISKLKDSHFEKYNGKTDILFAGFPCFVKDSLVLTNNGYKEIQNVSIDDKLLTHTGQFQNIINLQRKIYNRTLYNFKINSCKIIFRFSFSDSIFASSHGFFSSIRVFKYIIFSQKSVYKKLFF